MVEYVSHTKQSIKPLHHIIMNSEIITIGTELLLGEINDTNSTYIARSIRNIGLDLYLKTTVGDNEIRAAEAIKAALNRADIIITTGGLGPTVDDITRQAVALATNRQLEFRSELMDQISARFDRWGSEMSPNNRRQAYIPVGAICLENPVGTAPCFIVETEKGTVISLPGVPREMTFIMESVVIPYLKTKMIEPAVILTRVLRTAGIGESRVDLSIQDLEELSNPTVGLAAHAGQTDIRITAKAATIEKAKHMIEPIATDIRRRLGTFVYGEDQVTIEEALLTLAENRNQSLAIIEAGTEGEIARRLALIPKDLSAIVLDVKSFPDWNQLVKDPNLDSLETNNDSLAARVTLAASKMRTLLHADLSLVVLVEQDEGGHPMVALAISSQREAASCERGYGGPPEYLNTWACTTGFSWLRQWLLREKV